jgi:hypothetical protein
MRLPSLSRNSAIVRQRRARVPCVVRQVRHATAVGGWTHGTARDSFGPSIKLIDRVEDSLAEVRRRPTARLSVRSGQMPAAEISEYIAIASYVAIASHL